MLYRKPVLTVDLEEIPRKLEKEETSEKKGWKERVFSLLVEKPAWDGSLRFFTFLSKPRDTSKMRIVEISLSRDFITIMIIFIVQNKCTMISNRNRKYLPLREYIDKYTGNSRDTRVCGIKLTFLEFLCEKMRVNRRFTFFFFFLFFT